jgi:hypothetical protein
MVGDQINTFKWEGTLRKPDTRPYVDRTPLELV